MKKIQWGIVGPGIIAHEFAHDFQFAEQSELKAVASRSIDKSNQFAEKYTIPKAYGAYEELYNDPEIDAIYVATPHVFHLKNSVDAMKAGKAVLCEKPITHNLEDSLKLIEFAESSNSYLMEGMWTYFLPALIKAQEWIALGKIGRVLHVKSDFGYPVPYNTDRRMYNPELAGGSLLDMGIYNVAMAWLFFKADPKKTTVISRKAPTGVDNDTIALFEYEDAAATLISAFRCKLHNWCFVIGEKGYIAIPDFWRARECFLYEEEVIVEEFKDGRNGFGFQYEMDAVSRDLLAGKKESEIMPHSYSIKFQEHMSEIMKRF